MTYRVAIPCELYVNIEATCEAEAIEAAEELAGRMEDGVDVPDFDTEIAYSLDASMYLTTSIPVVKCKID